ncbi:polymorphic toxin-type HINT domain-containing protein [Micromonospora sp. NPDC050397]|uniref:polymorphic toxin-type HINT domain-containing protein n=1 Tax=Micromonospora sp. NPDC050397 TaxID=3364279 RepID=UPI00384E82EA
MFSRSFISSGVFRRRVVRPVAWAMAGVLGASLIQVATPPAAAAPKDSNRPTVNDSGRILGERAPIPVKPRKPDAAAKAAATKPAAPSWPAAGATEISLGANRSTGVAASGTTKAGGLAVSVGAATAPADGARTSSTAAVSTPGRVKVEVLERKVSERAKVDGPVLRLGRTDGQQTPGTVQLGVGYDGLANLFGGDFGTRLRLARLPECALSTPEKPECAAEPVPTLNNGEDHTLSAQASTPAGAGALYAMIAADSSSQGNYGATTLAPSSKWSVAPSTGGFSWSYPLRTPPVPGGGGPGITLAYSSQSVDGRTATTNNQGSWIGEGFSYEPGHIERRYKPCADDGHDTSADQCWAYDNATILLNGKSTELVKSGNTWKFATDDGSKVVRETGAVNGDDDGEHWIVSTTDGTKYYFGLNRLPGWSANKEETNSTWTLPVYGDDANEPCEKPAFADSYCDQAWRWSLDYVKDRYGNVTSYFYNRESNYFARGRRTDANGVEYHRGGWLKRVDYGQRDGQVYSTNAPARVRFDTQERCLPTTGIDCDPQDLNSTTASHWPDVPFDRNCAKDTKCKADQITATFWTRARLTGITTEIRGASGWTPVDEWKLDHLLTDNGDGSRTLWLHKITHTGKVGGSAAMPAIEFAGLQKPNRIDRTGDFIAPLIRFRMATVYTDTGAQIDVNYKDPDCAEGNLPTEGRSTRRCYPVKWNPLGSGDPTTDWFHKYVVDAVIETDRTGGSPDMVTRYDYLDGAAWRHAEPDGITDPEDLTWSEWRGYGKVVVTGGSGQTMTTKTEHRYLRGMHGDKDPDGGTRSVTIRDSAGVDHVDHDEFSGVELESKTFDGPTEISKTIKTPWRHTTATESHSWGAKRAILTNTSIARNFTAVGTGWRETKTTSEFETTFGRTTRTENEGDVSKTGDEACTRTTYADSEALHLYTLTAQVESVAVKCSTTPDRKTQVLSDSRTLYDNLAFGAVPTRGNPTRVERLASHNGTTPTYVRVAEGTFDSYGRPLTATDSVGTVTKTAYTETNGLTTKVVETSPLEHETTTNYAPAWGSPVSQVDPNDLTSELAYDPLGRLVTVWLPDRAGEPVPSIKYTYLVRTDKAVAVKTEKQQGGLDRRFSVEYQLYDGLLRPRQVQTEGPDGTRLIADTFYTATGKLDRTYATYHAAGAPKDEIYPAVNGDVNGQALYVYDGADRVKAEIFQVAGVEKWRTLTTYGGDRVSVDPPQGGTPTTTVSNALGQTTELLQYKGAGPSGDADKTEYTYTQSGQLETVKDPAGNVWRHKYDQRGRKIESVDPDAGTSTYRYDDLDRLTGTTNGVGAKLTHTYDTIGRKTATWKGDADTGILLSQWTYDQELLGTLSSTSRFVDGAAYTTYYGIYDEFYRPQGTYYEVPDHAGAELAGMYTYGTTYNPDGTVQTVGMSDGGGLPYEVVAYTYDDLDRLTATTGDSAYLTDVDYAATGEILQAEVAVGPTRAWSTYEWEQGSKRLSRQRLDRAGAPVVDIDARYSYDAAGNIQSIADTPSGTRDVQCFTYDYLRRMDRAWTSASTAEDPCAGGPAATGVGGVAPYHHSYTFDLVGNRKTETQYAANGTSLIERAYEYPAAGQAKPHTLSRMTETTSSGTQLHTYEYDNSGNTTKRTKAGVGQDLVWDAEGNLESVTEAGKKTSFLYDVDGSRMLRKEPDATTLYLPGMELRLDHTTRSVDGTRYYGIPGGGTLVRKLNGFHYVAPDHHGTGQAVVNQNGSVVHRRSTPYGSPRGVQPAPGQWPTEKGFVNGNQDSTTGLVNIGAREYDPITGRFISIDPIVDVGDPQQMHGYAYANNNPISFSDPDGLKMCSDDVCGPGADFVDSTGKYHDVPGHNDGCGGCSGAYDPDAPEESNPRNADGGGDDAAAAAAAAERARQARIAKAKKLILEAAKELADIAMKELGITDALSCLTKGDMGGCLETAINIATSFVGGMLMKFARKYGAPWQWDDGARLVQRVKGLLGKLISGVKNFFKKCHSFAPGTLVLMADGLKRPIEELREGDQVVATDPVTGKTEVREVTDTHTNQDRDLTDLALVVAGGDLRELKTTWHHPFWSEDRNEWVDAVDLRVGERLRGASRESVHVAAVRSYLGEKVMHDLTVAEIHTYHVFAGEAPVLVHNCDGNKPPFPNKEDQMLKTELAEAAEAGVKPVGVGEAGFDEVISAGNVKWAMALDGTIRVIPRSVRGFGEMSHAIIFRGADVLAAGEARIRKSGDGYVGDFINNHSGHYKPCACSREVAREAFAELGIVFPD